MAKSKTNKFKYKKRKSFKYGSIKQLPQKIRHYIVNTFKNYKSNHKQLKNNKNTLTQTNSTYNNDNIHDFNDNNNDELNNTNEYKYNPNADTNNYYQSNNTKQDFIDKYNKSSNNNEKADINKIKNINYKSKEGIMKYPHRFLLEGKKHLLQLKPKKKPEDHYFIGRRNDRRNYKLQMEQKYKKLNKKKIIYYIEWARKNNNKDDSIYKHMYDLMKDDILKLLKKYRNKNPEDNTIYIDVDIKITKFNSYIFTILMEPTVYNGIIAAYDKLKKLKENNELKNSNILYVDKNDLENIYGEFLFKKIYDVFNSYNAFEMLKHSFNITLTFDDQDLQIFRISTCEKMSEFILTNIFKIFEEKTKIKDPEFMDNLKTVVEKVRNMYQNNLI